MRDIHANSCPVPCPLLGQEPSGRRSARTVNEKEADETHANDLNLFRKYRVMEPLFAKRTTSQACQGDGGWCACLGGCFDMA